MERPEDHMAEKYQGLYDAIMEGEMVNVGRKVILPPIPFTGHQGFIQRPL